MTKGRRHKPEEIVFLLQTIDTHVSNGCRLARACYAAGIREPTYYRWLAEYGGLEARQAGRLKHLLAENKRLKQMLLNHGVPLGTTQMMQG